MLYSLYTRATGVINERVEGLVMRISALPSHVLSAVLEVLLMREPVVQMHHLDGADDYITDELPPVGMKVEVIGHVGNTRHEIPFLCCWTEEGWIVAGSRRKLAFNVAGWRRAGI